jgi:hypothetical protein
MRLGGMRFIWRMFRLGEYNLFGVCSRGVTDEGESRIKWALEGSS